MNTITVNRNERRKKRISSNIKGSMDRIRIAVHRTNKFVYAQAIDDVSRKTIAAVSTSELRTDKKAKVGSKTEESKKAGIELAKKIIAANVKAGVFDRGRFTYNGRIKAFAEGLREGGLII